jgi:glutamine amidotransferase-like uncharacterized protein
MDAIASKIELPARPRTREAPPGRWSGATGVTATLARLWFLIAFFLAACTPPAPSAVPPIIVYTGTGTSANDVAAVETILKANHFQYATATTRQLNGMNALQLAAHRLMIVPGGDFIAIGNSLAPGTMVNIHDAVQGGLNYLGICAGAFLAGKASYNSLNLTSGVRFGFYAAERQGIRKAVVAIAGTGTPPIEHYWEDGPEFTGWGAVVGTYPDGTPAIVEGPSGKGWVVLSGVHAEAPEQWRRGMAFSTPASAANAYAATLIEAALQRRPLAHH